MTYQLAAVLSSVLLSSVALAQESAVGVENQAIVPQEDAPAATFTNEVRFTGVSLELSQESFKGFHGKTVESESSTTRIATLPAQIDGKFSFGSWVVRPTLSMNPESTSGALALGHTFGVLEGGLGASLDVANVKTKNVKSGDTNTHDNSSNVVFAYGILKPQLDAGVSLEIEGQAGYIFHSVSISEEPSEKLTGFGGVVEARLFVDVTPQLALGVSAGLDYTKRFGEIRKEDKNNIYRFTDVKVSTLTWEANLANIRYSF